jgi:hypothetical protein
VQKSFFLNYDSDLSEKSYKDCMVVKSNGYLHSKYCLNQVPLKERSFSQYVKETGLPQEIQAEKRKYPRFGPGGALQRQFRTNHTEDAIKHGQVSIKKISQEMNFHLKGAEFLAKITTSLTTCTTTRAARPIRNVLTKLTEFFFQNVSSSRVFKVQE